MAIDLHPEPTAHTRARTAGPLRAFRERVRDMRDPRALYPVLVGAVCDALGGPTVALFTPDPYRGGYLLRAACGLQGAEIDTLRLTPDDLPASLRASIMAAVEGIMQQGVGPIRVRCRVAGLDPFRPALALPLLDADRLLGFLLIGKRPDARAYSPSDLSLLGLLSEAAAAAISAADIAWKYGRSRRQLETLNRLGEELSANLDIEAVCLTVHDHLSEALDFDSFFISRYDEDLSLLTFPFGIDEGVRYQLEPAPLGSGLASTIFETGRPLVIDDLFLGVEHYNLPRSSDLYGSPRRSRSWMGVPMLAKHRAIGVLSVQSYTPNLYTHEQVQFLSIVANQVAGALENARLFAERERLYQQTDTALATRVVELSALEEIARLLNASLELGRIIHLVVARAVETTGAAAGMMTLFDQSAQALHVLGHIGYTQEVMAPYKNRALPISLGIIGRAVREDRSLLVRDVGNDPDYFEVLPDVRSQLVVLVRRGGQLLGALSMESTDAGGFTEQHVNFAEHLAEHAAIAVDNARRYDRERRQNETLTRRAGELAAILHSGNALKADLSIDQVLTQIADGVRTSLGFNIAVLSLLREGPPPHFERVAAVGLDPGTWEILRSHPSPYAEGLTLMDPRFQISQSYFISHLYNVVTSLDSYYRPTLDARSEQEWHPDDMLLVPLRGKGGQLIGVLSVDDPQDRRLPSRATIETLEIFANQAVIALENSRLFEEQRHLALDLTTLHEAGLGFTATLDISTLLEETARFGVRLLDADSSGVLLVEEPSRQVANVRCWARQGGTLEVATYFSHVREGGLTDGVLRSGIPLMIGETLGDARINPATLAEGIRSLIVVPIRTVDRTLGVFFVNSYKPHAFSLREQRLLQIFANQVAVAVQNARLFSERRTFEERLVAENSRMARELVTARATQRKLLPEMPRRVAGLQIHGICLPAMEVGGDYFDVLPLPDGRLGLALGDVTGKGTSAVMLMAMIKTALLSQIEADPAPQAVLAALNALAVEYMQGRLMTFFYGLYDPTTHSLSYGNAGHLYPYIRRADGTLESLDQGGLPLGAHLDPGDATPTAEVRPGDLLVFFSDGIVETMDETDALFGFDRLESLLRDAGSEGDPVLLVEDIVDRVHNFASGAPQDDVTLLIARCDEW
ncbi:MAG: GAF domain-containing protein [Chloroflexia bacterium]